MRGPARIIKEDPHRINRKITARELRLVGDNVEVGVYSLDKALELADELDLDLVEISPNADPPIERYAGSSGCTLARPRKTRRASCRVRRPNRRDSPGTCDRSRNRVP